MDANRIEDAVIAYFRHSDGCQPLQLSDLRSFAQEMAAQIDAALADLKREIEGAQP